MSRLAEKDPKASEMFAAQVIQSLPGSPGKGTKRLVRSRGGAPLSVQVAKPHPVRRRKSGSKTLSSGDVSKWEATTNMTTNMRNQSVSFLNKQRAGKVFAGNVKQKILDEKKALKPYFKVSVREIDGKTFLIAHADNVLEFVQFILEKRGPKAQHRNMMGEMLHRFSLDWGQGFLKLSLNLVDMVNARDLDRVPLLSGFHDSGLKGTQIVAIAMELKESHEAFKEFFRLVQLELVDYFWLAADFKADNFAAGIQACSATFACPYCNSSIHSFDTEGTLRTIQGIKDKRDEWIGRWKGNRNKLNEVEGCEHYPALPGRGPEEEILNILAPGELHLVLGIVNKVLTEIRAQWKDGIDEWFRSLSLDATGYRFEKTEFNGNNCAKVLKQVDSLIEQTRSLGMVWVQPHLRALKVFSKVVSSCFGFVLDPDYRAHIDEFKDVWQSLVEADSRFSFFYKIHVLVCHVAEFVERHGPLGPFSEQAGESLHSSWLACWKRYKNLPGYDDGQRLLMALIDYNHRHLSLIDPAEDMDISYPDSDEDMDTS